VIRVGVVSPEPTPYRAPLFDRIATLRDLDLTVVYAARTVAARTWSVELHHRAVFLEGLRLPTARVLHHDYPLTPSIVPLLERERFDVLVVAGWSLFAAQASAAWARIRRVPYLVMSESHLLDPRPGPVRMLKRLVIPQVVRPAAGCLVTGSGARDAVVAFGADPARVRVFANTIDVEAFERRVDAHRRRRDEARTGLGLQDGEVAVLSAARLDQAKGLDVLLRAAAAVPGVRVVLAGSGPDEAALRGIGAPATFAGFLGPDELAAAYAAADVFALVSRHEPWGVVVVEAAAAGLPLLLSDRVGAAADLLRPQENGELVPADDAAATTSALGRLAADAGSRSRYGARSRELAAAWGYGPSVQAFRDAVVEAHTRR
jgi:glycosyltransferase involved in cell wall biosynthesis